MKLDADWAFIQYERTRNVLPQAVFPEQSTIISHMGEIADKFDVFLLDAFGVLNIGDRVIPGANEWVADLQAAGKDVVVVGNGASYPSSVSLEKYKNLGYEFDPVNIISSRDILANELGSRAERLWGVMVDRLGGIEQLPVDCVRLTLEKADYDRVDGFVFLGSGTWSDAQQKLLTASLKKHPRAVLVGNPDIIAPRENRFSLEPGWYAHELAHNCPVNPVFFGKPFGNIYAPVISRFGDKFPRERMVMVGDSLHTDILGGAAIGVKTVLMADYGLFKGKDVQPYIEASGIVPDWILTAK